MADTLTTDNQISFIHLSDIHFEEPYCLKPDRDPEETVRQALLADIHEMKNKVGPISGVLISGDIAYKGHPDEYRAAKKWLTQLTDICGCPPDSVFTAPGNH